MKVCFFHSDKPRERLLSEAFLHGVAEHGDQIVARPLTPEVVAATDCEVAVMVGVKSRELWHANHRAGLHLIMLDKGYVRHSGTSRTWEYWRVSVDSHHPTQHLMRVDHPSDRFEKLGLKVKPWRSSGRHIVFAGSSAKYHEFYGLHDPTRYAEKIFKQIRRVTQNREIVYRPKPSWHDAVPIDGTTYSTGPESILDVLQGAHCLITHGSNACFEATLNGVPSIILGDGVAKPISSTDLNDIVRPKTAKDKERNQWLWNLAYWEWTMTEMHSGETWKHIRPFIFG